jgi:hypothetical protein
MARMNANTPPLFTEHRRRRLILWVLTALGWLAEALFGDRDVSARHFNRRLRHVCLEEVTQKVAALLIARALRLANMRTRRRAAHWRHGRNMRPRHWMRSLLGCRLRRALRHKDIATHIARLVYLLRHFETYARRLAHRMRHGLMRLWRTWSPVDPHDLMPDAMAPLPASSDSS